MLLSLPLPLPGASQNYHGHWNKRQRDTRHMRMYAAIIAKKHLGPGRQHVKDRKPVKISATFFMGPTIDPRYRAKDTANAIASIKPYIDGLVDAGLVPDDSHNWVSWGEVKLLRDAKQHKGRACVELTIEERVSA